MLKLRGVVPDAHIFATQACSRTSIVQCDVYVLRWMQCSVLEGMLLRYNSLNCNSIGNDNWSDGSQSMSGFHKLKITIGVFTESIKLVASLDREAGNQAFLGNSSWSRGSQAHNQRYLDYELECLRIRVSRSFAATQSIGKRCYSYQLLAHSTGASPLAVSVQ